MNGRSGFFANVDEHVLARARRGDRDALAALYRIFAGPVHNLALRICGSVDEAEDVLQETFLEVVRSVGSFRGEAPVGAWLRRVALSKILTRRRRAEVRRIEVPSAGAEDAAAPDRSAADGWSAAGLRVDVERALAELGETSRLVLWLYHVEGMTHTEIGALLGRSPSFSKSRLSRAHERLRRRWTKPWSTEDASDHRAAAGSSGR